MYLSQKFYIFECIKTPGNKENRNRPILKIKFVIILFLAGCMGLLLINLFPSEPCDRYIHVENFRYGKRPNIIRCNRGDRLHLTFSTLDTGHSFFLEEFGVDVKVSPGMEEVSIFDAKKPLDKPVIANELILTAEHPGISKYLISKSQYRCHVWCGPLHAFEQGSLIIFPNSLLGFGTGILLCLLILLFIPGYHLKMFKISEKQNFDTKKISNFWNGVFHSATTKNIITILCLLLIYTVVLISIFGTQNAGRNLGSMIIWMLWLPLLIVILIPFFGRLWCYICPLPFFGELLQRGSMFFVRMGKTGRFNNKFSGLNLRWPEKLNNSWPLIISFMILGTFSTTLVSVPKTTGLVLLSIVLIIIILSLIFELRAFCRYLCPINAFMGYYARTGKLALRVNDVSVCSKCKGKFCETGSNKGWACPYGLNCETIIDNSKCGLCMECLRSCSYENTGLRLKPFGISPSNLTLSESFLGISLLVMGVIYCIVYHGPWSELREYINIIDKNNYNLFLIYTIVLWFSSLVFFPALLLLISYITKKYSKSSVLKTPDIFKHISNAIIPVGLTIWMAFAIPLVMVNFTFVLQSLSDPFGWGWNLFGFAGLPWKQLFPRSIPWIQVLLVITGILFSLKNLYVNLKNIISEKEINRSLKIIGSSFIVFGFLMVLLFAYY